METESRSKGTFFSILRRQSPNRQSHETQNPNPNGFEDLSPSKDVKGIKTYSEALEWALNNDNINNIAVTGPYGSGKSSVLRTFEDQHPNHHFLNISLASFKETESAGLDINIGTNGVNTENQDRLIELSILQQMFYKVTSEQIPNSRFDRIEYVPKSKFIWLAFYSILFLFGFLIIFFPDFIERFDWWYNFRTDHPQISLYIAIGCLFPISRILFYSAVSFLNSSKFNKVNLTKGEIEFDLKSDASILNKHIDEILYFFKVTSYDVIVFEDLDRFNRPEIFTKLREINLLINNSQEISRHVTFIYAIKDDMFQDKTRTKFFDFIMPIIPVINWSNSYEKMREKFQNKESQILISDNFINAITLFIDDMRILKNIFNEFVIYKKKLENLSLNQEKLLAIIIYKNIYPNDFAALHENKGIVFNVFQQKQSIYLSEIENKRKKIEDCKKRIATLKEDNTFNIYELRGIYLLEIIKQSNNAIAFQINGSRCSFADVQHNDEYFDWLKSREPIYYYHYGQQQYQQNNILITNTLSLSFKEIEDKVNSDLTYDDRLSLVLDGASAEINTLTKLIDSLEDDIFITKSKSLKEIFMNDSNLLNSLFDEIKGKELLRYLIREGYIDENYPSFISYFYEGSLTSKDKNFLLSVQNREQLEFDYPVSNLQNIVERLDESDFKKDGILNFKLLDYLLSEENKHTPHLMKLFSKFNLGSSISLQFIYDYSKEGNQKEKFYSFLFENWPAFWDFIFNKSDYSFLEKDKYLIILINYADENAIRKLNSNYNLSKYISLNNRFLDLFTNEIEISRAINVISYCNIKFDKLDRPKNNSEILNFICENDAYSLNEEMIDIVLEYNGKRQSKSSIDKANYTAVKLSEYNPLINYVKENINKYVTSIMLSEKNTKETEASVVELLSNSDLTDDLKRQIIEHQETKIENILSIPESTWSVLLLNKKLKINWANILIYFEKFHFSDEMIETLNTEEFYLSLSKNILELNENLSDYLLESFSGQLLLNNRITDSAYLFLIESIPYQYPNGLDISGLNEVKVRALIEKQKIILNNAAFVKTKEFHSNLTVVLVERNIDEYLNNFNSYPIQISDYIYLLRSNHLADNIKSKLLQTINIDLLGDETFNASVTTYLIDSPVSDLPPSLLKEIVISDKTTNKLDILTKYLNLLDKEEIFSLLPFLGNKLEEIRPGGDDLQVAYNEFDSALLEGLKRKNVIKSYKKQKDEIIIKNIEN